MNKKLTERIKYITLFIWATLLLTCTAHSQKVYEWKGNNGNWDSLSNWSISGSVPARPPGENDQVWVSSHEDISVKIHSDIEINSLTVQGNVSLETKKNTAFLVNGSIFMAQGVTLSENISIIGKGFLEEAHLSVPNDLKDKVKVAEGSSYKTISSNSVAGSCPFFTIEPDPTPPTCNGFSDGIAAVLEPTDGVGPFTYQWVGGPSTPQWNNRSAGTYTIIVIDLGQGGLPCNLDVFVNEPGPLTVFSMNASAPLCADVCNGTASPIVSYWWKWGLYLRLE